MNFGDFKNALRRNIFDLNSDWLNDNTTDYAGGFVNDAMMHVANWADRQDQGLFHRIATTYSVATGSANEVVVPFYGTTGTFALPDHAKFRRLLAVEEITTLSAVKTLQVVPMEDRLKYPAAAQTATPRCYVSGNSLVLIAPSNSLLIRLRYVYSLPVMRDNYDTPGEQDGVYVEQNALPIEYHPLVVTYATVLALAAEASPDVQAWTAIYAEQRDELAATLTKRRGPRTGIA